MAVYLVKQQSSTVLLQRLRSKGIRNPDHSRALIKEKLTADPDSEIATTSLRVSLLCPLGKMASDDPVPGADVSHLQCFDATLYIQMNEKKPTWVVPSVIRKPPTNISSLTGETHNLNRLLVSLLIQNIVVLQAFQKGFMPLHLFHIKQRLPSDIIYELGADQDRVRFYELGTDQDLVRFYELGTDQVVPGFMSWPMPLANVDVFMGAIWTTLPGLHGLSLGSGGSKMCLSGALGTK
nr:uncharacterized protein LOC112076892 [Salvelinus alpinus]